MEVTPRADTCKVKDFDPQTKGPEWYNIDTHSRGEEITGASGSARQGLQGKGRAPTDCPLTDGLNGAKGRRNPFVFLALDFH